MLVNHSELFPIVDRDGNIIGKATRQECHSGTFYLHPVVHLHVFNSEGKIFLQKRADDKDIQPGKWDTAVGGHVDLGEQIEEALKRETGEELGIWSFEPVFIEKYVFTSLQESELINCYYTIYDGPITPDTTEITEGRFWTIAEIHDNLGKEVFTPNFENEYEKIVKNILQRLTKKAAD